MKKKYFIILSLLLLIPCFFAVGCVRKSASQKVTIRYANPEGTQEQVALMKLVITEFQRENPGIEVVLEAPTSSEKIITEIAGKVAPDVFYQAPNVDALAQKGVILDLQPYVIKYRVDLSQYYPFLVDYFRIGNGLYGFPLHFSTQFVLYNQDIFDRAGLAYPKDNWTWNDYYDLAKRLTVVSKTGRMREQIGSAWPYPQVVINLFGGRIVDEKVRKSAIDSRQTRSALEFLLKMKPYCPRPSEEQSLGGNVGTQFFATGKVGLQVGATWMLSVFSKIKTFRWDVAPVPVVPGQKSANTFGSGGLCISSQTKHPDEAFKFVSFYCGLKGQKLLAEAKNCIPAHRKIAETVFAAPPPAHVRYFLPDPANNLYPQPRLPEMYEISKQVVEPQLDLLFLGKQDITATLQKITEKTNEILGNKK